MTHPLLLARNQIEDTRWNSLISVSEYPVPYAYTWYLDAVSPQWQALVWPSAQQYEIVMPLPIRKKWGFDVVQQPLFCQYLGLFSQSALSEATLSLFLSSVSTHFMYVSVYSFHPSYTPVLRGVLTRHPEFKHHENTTHWLELGKTHDELYAKYTNDRKTNLKRSLRYGWEIIDSENVLPLIDLFRENHAPQIKGIHESAFELFLDLTGKLRQIGACKIRYAVLEGTIHAGILILQHNNMGIYLFNAADSTGRKGNARTLLVDNYLRESADNLSVFDFESPEVPDIAHFYVSFGADEQKYISIKKNKLPFPLRQLVEWRKRWLTSS